MSILYEGYLVDSSSVGGSVSVDSLDDLLSDVTMLWNIQPLEVLLLSVLFRTHITCTDRKSIAMQGLCAVAVPLTIMGLNFEQACKSLSSN